MNKEIFRQKSIDKVKSPENLDDYIQVSNPGVWLLLVCIILLLAGACVWGAFGHVDSTVKARVLVEDEEAVCYLAVEDAPSVKVGMTVQFDGYEAVIMQAGQEGLSGAFILSSQQEIPDGTYQGEIVVERIRPLSFVLN